MADLAHFAEDTYLPSPQRAVNYYKIVERGKVEMRRQNVVIAGLARNIAAVVGKTMARIERLGQMFNSYSVVIFENDSRDNTLEQLQGWARSNANVTIMAEMRQDPINPGIRCLNRAARMAFYRNKYREYIHERLATRDAVIVLDTDLCNGWSYDGIANTFGQAVDWHFVGSNGIIFKDYEGTLSRSLFYDVWAFRWRNNWTPIPPGHLNPRFWPRGEPMLRVNSCFGGLGVYRMPAFLAGKYDGSDCEHVPFHRQLIEAGYTELYMNPSQIVWY